MRSDAGRPFRGIPAEAGLPEGARGASARAGEVAALAFRALAAEALAAPKPGLVDRLGSGVHRDMDLGLLLRSAGAIAPFIGECWRTERETPSPPDVASDARLERLRPLGLEAERAMLAATGGVNAHKGAIFAFGLLAAAAGALAARGGPGLAGGAAAEAICDKAAALAAGVQDRDFAKPELRLTAGARMVAAVGPGGARAEAEAGFPSLRSLALPRLRAALRARGALDEADLVDALLSIMTGTADSCLWKRGGAGGLAFARAEARAVLDSGGAGNPAGRARLAPMRAAFLERNLSPGGAADLLAAAVFLLSLERGAPIVHGYRVDPEWADPASEPAPRLGLPTRRRGHRHRV